MKNTYILGLITIVSLFMSSCSKWLDLQPQDGITKAEFWKTKEDVRAGLMGIYSSLNSGTVESKIFLWGELRADMVSVTSYATEDYRLVKNMNTLSTNAISTWNPLYTVINNCNLLIDFAPDAKTADPTFTDHDYNSYVGEALTVRSLLYFYLIRTFKEIPLKLKGSYKDTDVVNIGQSTADVVLKQIEADLLKAQSMLPDNHVNVSESFTNISASNTARITKAAATTLLAEVYLWKEEYAKAGVELDKVLNMSRFKMLGRSSINIFDGTTAETIFEISHKDSKANPMYSLVVDGRKPYAAATDIINSDIFPPNMEIDVNLVDSRGEGYLYSSNGTIWKYGSENPSYYNYQIYRISDVILMKAEVLAEQGNGVEALALLNSVREARGAIAASDAIVTSDDLEGIIRFIFAERAREFCFEGKRWYDLLRLAKKDNYSNLDVLIDVVTKVVDASVQQSAINKIRDYNSHYLPIYEDELFKDPLLVQNPFYLK